MANRPDPDRTTRDVLEERLFGEIHLRASGKRNRNPEGGDGRGTQGHK